MKKSRITSLMIALLLIVYACPAVFATDITLLGPKKYVRTSGPPDYYLSTFCGVPGEAVIRLQNGDNSGEKRVEDSVSSALVRVNGHVVFGPEDFNKNIFIMESTIPIFMDNTLTVELGSAPQSYITISIARDSLLPQASLHIDPEIISASLPAVLTWTSTQGNSVHIDQGIGTVPSNGTISVYPEHTTTYTLTVTGPTGTVSEQATILVNGNPEPLSEGSFGKQYQDLIPNDATTSAYDSARFSIVTGMVHDAAGLSLENVMVRIVGHPEYGSVYTAVDGRFSIPVEGGKTFTIAYQEEGLLESQRKVYVPWNDITRVDTVQMIAEDSLSTHITFDGDPDTVVTHRSTEVCDVFGSRSCSLVFSGDNQAFLVDESGNDVHELTTINVRATEYRTPTSMPAELPPNSAFTYCVELSVDGAKNVRFSNPVAIWVDNFLEFDVGEVIPVGFYNRHKGFWEPAQNGVVVKLLDTDADSVADALDATGDDQPDDLNENGTFLDEIKGLQENQGFRPGATFWRAETTHFTPCDLNLPKGSPPDAVRPNSTGIATADTQPDNVHSCYRQNASFVEDRSRIFHEDIPVPGTQAMLHYASNRVNGYHTHITIPVSGDTVPASLKRMIVKVEVGGHTFSRELAPLPDQVTDFYWDGLDYDGRSLQTPITAHVAVGFVYDSLYYSPGNFEQAFGQPGIAATDVPAREEIILWEQKDLLISPPRSKGTVHLAEGWSLSPHHHMNLQDYASLHKGDGTLINTNVRVISMIYLSGLNYFHYPDSVAVDAAGDIYVAESFRGVVYKIDPEGNRTRFTGEFNMWGYSGDGGPAIEAKLYKPNGVAVDNYGNVYVTDLFRIRKIDVNGIITTIAGTGIQGYTGDGGPAVNAQVWSPKGITVDSEGNIYFAESDAHCIRKIDTNGIITTIAGNGSSGFAGDGGPAVNAALSSPHDVAVDANGNLYVADSNNNRIRMIDTGGIITTMAGSGTVGLWGGGFGGDGGPADDAKMRRPKSVDVDTDGNIYVGDSGNFRIRLVNNCGIITTIAGSGAYGWDSRTHPAVQATFKDTSGLAVDAGGNIYLADTDNHSIRKISHPSVFKHVIMSGGNVFSEKSGQGHIISIEGMHTQTIDLDSGIALYSYQYDDNKKLISITDQFGNVTTVTRDVNGSPTAIISPNGITTDLTIDLDNHLTRITYPDGGYYDFEYTAGGLLTAKIEPNGNRFEHLFDDRGRLVYATDQAGGNWAYARAVDSNGDNLTQISTAEGNITSYLDLMDNTGAYTSIVTDSTGAETLFHRSSDRLSSHKSLPCGMELSFAYDLDTEYLHTVLKEIKETTPSGLTRIITRDKIYQDMDYDSLPDLITQTMAVNGKTASIQNNVPLSQETSSSPEGRVVTTWYDPLTLLATKRSIPGRYDITYGYDSRGKLTAVNTHTRESSLTYNADGFIETITDGENHTTRYGYDASGRIIQVDRPDNSSIQYTYDGNGNMTILTNPSATDHGLGYNTVNSQTSYQTPLSGSYHYAYDRDRRLTRISFPSGKEINQIYDGTRLAQIRTPEGNIEYTYLCGTKVDSMTQGTEAVAYGYDGRLVTSELLSGTLNQEIYYNYNDDFDITEVNYADSTESYAYDNDGLLTGAGRFSIARNADNAQPELVTDGTIRIARTFNGYGEVDEEMTAINVDSIFSWWLDRDDTGRVVQKTETIADISYDYHFAYDAMGRLLSVTQNGILTEAYQYDPNGTRSYEMNVLRGIAGKSFAYSGEEHLLTAGTASYQYDSDGFLIRKTDGSDVVTYTYSSRGELLNVMLADEIVIEYIYDPLGRRIAKKVNGALTEKYLWQSLTRLLAVYDGADSLVMRFEYADSRLPATVVKNGVTYYLIYDPVGSLRVIADTAGIVVKRIDYDAFGNVTNETNPSFDIPFGFAGGLYDKDTGLIRFGYRDYDPDIGRWTAKDPIFFKGGDVDLYGYCLNDPLNLVDPYGLEISDIFPGIRTAIVQGFKGGAYSVGEAGKFFGSNIKPSEQTLKVTIEGATVFGTASAISANIPATITFSVIGGSAKALKSALYSDTPCNDAILHGIQSAVKAPPAIDPLVDKIIEESLNIYIETKNLPKM